MLCLVIWLFQTIFVLRHDTRDVYVFRSMFVQFAVIAPSFFRFVIRGFNPYIVMFTSPFYEPFKFYGSGYYVQDFC